jgi:3-oxoacyl-[acyl-carrier-protein] synthase-1
VQPLAVTRFSIVNCLGRGRQAIADALRDGRSGLSPCDFETVALDAFIGRIPDVERVSVRADLEAFDCRNNRVAQLGLEADGFVDAVRRASERVGPERVGVFMGTSTSGILETEIAYRSLDTRNGALPEDFRYAETHNAFSLAVFVQRYLGLKGPALVVSTACSSSSKVFGNASRMIEAGICDAAVVGGVDSLCLTSLYGFRSLGLVSRFPCRPFDQERDGISIGEGAGFVLLEKQNSAAEPETMVLGVGESCDAHHMSTPHPDGAGARLSMVRALEAAGLEPRDIDYINLHGTATRTNDAAEDHAVYDLFGDETPCSSTKGATGHLLGAAGISEAIVCMLALREGMLPGSVQTKKIDRAIRCRYLLQSEDAPVGTVVTNSFGFGGSNCSLVLGSVR